MRFPLGFNILLVLILGLLCVSTISSYESSEGDESPALAPTSAPALPQPENASVPEINQNDQSSAQQTKRGMGMPLSASGREMNGMPEDIGSSVDQQEQVISSPVNPPSNMEIAVDKPPTTPQESQARGLGSDIMSAIGNNPLSSTFQQQQQQQQQQQPQQQQQQPQQQQQQQQQLQQQQQSTSSFIPPPQVRQEDLPTIIENNRPVSPGQPSLIDPQQQQHQLVQSSQQAGSPGAAAPQQSSDNNNSQLVSTARTMDSWTSCVGASSNKYGTCKNDVDCNKKKGRADGSCMGGLGVCCVMALTCGDKSSENNTFFANPDFPESSWEARLCEVEVKKKSSSVLQVMIEFEDFELAPPNGDGECVTDVFMIKLASNRPSPYSLLRICGQNTGQHMYLDVSQLDEPLVLSLATSGGGYPRRWSIRIVQMDDKNHLLAPPGCLQYYTDTVGHFRSFNLGRNLKSLYYAICFRIDNGYSGIRFTENFFGMNGPGCRRRLTGPNGRINATYGAHPHHLVIPPPGLGHSLQPQHLQHAHPGAGHPGHQGPWRFKRFAYAEPSTERTPRTLSHEKEHKFEEKEYKHEEHSYGPPAYGPPVYGPPPTGYGKPHAYGSSHPIDGGYYQENPYKGEWKGDLKEEKFHDKHHLGHPHPHPHHQHPHPNQHEHELEASKSWGWGKWGGSLGGSLGIWKSDSKEQKPYNEHGGYPPNSYGPVAHGSYGHSGYGPPAYGNYHHKEIDQFGKKYEHLEYKHEKNHHELEAEKSKGWWPSWGTKKEEKKDKKVTHHEALFPMIRMPEMPHCEPRFCGQNDVITFPPSGESISEMCGNKFNRGRGPKIISGSPLVVYVSNRGHNRGAGFDMNYEQVFFIPNRY